MSELLAWAGTLPGEVLVAAMAILAAYAFSIQTWRRQKRTELGLSAAAELNRFVEDAVEDLLDLEIFSDRLIKLHADLLGDRSWDEYEFDAYYVGSRIPEMEERLQRVRMAARRVYGIRTRHGLVFEVGFLVSNALIAAEMALDEVSASLPVLPPRSDAPAKLLAFVAQADETKWRHFSCVSDQSRTKLHKSVGTVTGFFHAGVFHPTLQGFVRFIKTSRWITDPDGSADG
ncbi:hypothetical protein [Lysobacter sp. CA196]|uniref:hypothetical protein n=1 Tax=Lysobacter sp. CA196 TaxID=3455606 RepID=UPI003F8CF988